MPRSRSRQRDLTYPGDHDPLQFVSELFNALRSRHPALANDILVNRRNRHNGQPLDQDHAIQSEQSFTSDLGQPGHPLSRSAWPHSRTWEESHRAEDEQRDHIMATDALRAVGVDVALPSNTVHHPPEKSGTRQASNASRSPEHTSSPFSEQEIRDRELFILEREVFLRDRAMFLRERERFMAEKELFHREKEALLQRAPPFRESGLDASFLLVPVRALAAPPPPLEAGTKRIEGEMRLALAPKFVAT